jgi:hypothetical protein
MNERQCEGGQESGANGVPQTDTRNATRFTHHDPARLSIRVPAEPQSDAGRPGGRQEGEEMLRSTHAPCGVEIGFMFARPKDLALDE